MKIHILDASGFRLLCTDNPSVWDKAPAVELKNSGLSTCERCKRCLAKRVHGFDLRELKDVFERIDRLYPEESPKKRGGK